MDDFGGLGLASGHTLGHAFPQAEAIGEAGNIGVPGADGVADRHPLGGLPVEDLSVPGQAAVLAQHGDHAACALALGLYQEIPDIVVVSVIGEEGVVDIGQHQIVGLEGQALGEVVDPDLTGPLERREIAVDLAPALAIDDIEIPDKGLVLLGQLDLLHGVAHEGQMHPVAVHDGHLCHTGGLV